MKDLYKLKFIIRYSNIPRIRDESVAEHSFFVGALCVLSLEEYPEADAGKVLLMANIHDWAEAEIDDIAHNIKRDYPAVRKALKSAELKVMRKYPEFIREAYEEYEEGLTLEARIVKAADIRQCIQYLGTEISLGNTHMASLLEESYDTLASLNIKDATKQLRMDFANK